MFWRLWHRNSVVQMNAWKSTGTRHLWSSASLLLQTKGGGLGCGRLALNLDSIKHARMSIAVRFQPSLIYFLCLFHSHLTIDLCSAAYASSYHRVDMDLEICKVAFNVTDVYESIEASINYYGGLDVNGGTRVLFLNGDVDPWSALGLLNSTDDELLPTVVVPGASHHAWTHMKKTTDSKEIEDARAIIYSTVTGWLFGERAIERERNGETVGSLRINSLVSST